MRISYEQACEKILENGCSPLFTKEEWMGVRKNKKIMKYWFKDKMGHSFYARYDFVSIGRKTCCNECAKQSEMESKKLTEEEFEKCIEDFKVQKNIEILTPYSEYKNIKQKLECRCLLCNIIFKEDIDNIRKKDSHGCISIPKGELMAIDMCEKNGIDYNYQVYLQDLNLISDFEIKLEDGSLIHLEIDGDQHYDFPNEFHRTIEDYLRQKDRDAKKDNWYTNQGFQNLHIRYNVGGKHNDDIELIIKNIINGQYGQCKIKKINEKFNASHFSKKSNKNKKVIAYTLDGNFYGVYENMLEAESVLGVDNTSISQCVYQKRNIRRAGNFIFRLYQENFPKNIEPYKKSSSKPVYILKDGDIIDEKESLNALAREYNIHSSSLSRYLNGKVENPSNIYDFAYKDIYLEQINNNI